MGWFHDVIACQDDIMMVLIMVELLDFAAVPSEEAVFSEGFDVCRRAQMAALQTPTIPPLSVPSLYHPAIKSYHDANPSNHIKPYHQTRSSYHRLKSLPIINITYTNITCIMANIGTMTRMSHHPYPSSILITNHHTY